MLWSVCLEIWVYDALGSLIRAFIVFFSALPSGRRRVPGMPDLGQQQQRAAEDIDVRVHGIFPISHCAGDRLFDI